MKWLFLLFVCMLSSGLFAQSTAFAQKEKLNADLDQLQKILYLNHPNTFLYTKKASLDSLFETLRFNEKDKLNYLEIEKKIRTILSAVGCIHTSITKSVSYNNKDIIPIDIFTNGSNIWVKQTWSDSLKYLVGSQLLSINGHSSQNILKEMNTFLASDGYNQTFKDRLLNKGSFRSLYNYYFDTDSLKEMIIVTPKNDTISQFIKNTHWKKVDKKPIPGLKMGKYVYLNFDSIHPIATIKITSFNRKGSFRKLKNKYHEMIQLINDRGIPNVVIDLRDNLGGDATNANIFMSHFLGADHLIDKERMKNKSFKYSMTSSKLLSGIDYILKLVPRRKIRTDSSFIITTNISKKTKNHFDGNIFILVNGFSASASSNVASILRYKSNAIIIGQETGGAEETFNAFLSPKYRLSESKIQLKIPKYRIHLRTTRNTGSGVRPDHEIQYTIKDILGKKDLEYQKVIQLIQ